MWTLRRQAARVVVLDPSSRVLLLHASDPARPARGSWWELPGGGIEAGEPAAVAAARELYEETGIEDASMGPCVWRQRACYTFAGINFEQDEYIFVARVVAALAYQPKGLEAMEAVAFSGARWWAVDDLAAAVGAGERVIPPWLPGQLASLGDGAAEGWPGEPIEPIDMGEIGDVFEGL
jgi:8-oxo-dGTP pyrophosphatase MutT (NUDIX family)